MFARYVGVSLAVEHRGDACPGVALGTIVSRFGL